MLGNTNHQHRNGSHRGKRVRMNPDRAPVVHQQGLKGGIFHLAVTTRMMPTPKRVVK